MAQDVPLTEGLGIAGGDTDKPQKGREVFGDRHYALRKIGVGHVDRDDRPCLLGP